MHLTQLQVLMLCLFLVVPIRPIKIQSARDWVYLTTSRQDGITWKTFYDQSGIRRKPGDLVEVWLKQVPLTKNRKQKRAVTRSIVENRQLNGEPTTGYEKFGYSLTLLELDCNNKLGRQVSVEDYDQNGKLLANHTIAGGPWAPVVKASSAEIVLRLVCKQ